MNWIQGLAVGMCCAAIVGGPVWADDQKAAPEAAEAASKAQAVEDAEGQTLDMDRVSYALGMSIGRDIVSNFERQQIALNADRFLAGMTAQIDDQQQPELDAQEMRSVLSEFQQFMMMKQMEQRAAAEAVNGAEPSQQFLEANVKKDGIQVTESGLQYQVLTEGEGDAPQATDQVKVHYAGTLIDGTEFDSSYSRGEPATFPVNRVIKGWTEALQLMKPGAKWKLFIPSELAYGKRGSPPKIPADAALVFTVELLEVIPTPAAP